MIRLKSQREITIMRDAGRIVAECHAALAEKIEPGITTWELDQFVEQFLARHGAAPQLQGVQRLSRLHLRVGGRRHLPRLPQPEAAEGGAGGHHRHRRLL